MGRPRGGLTTKIRTPTDGHGLPLDPVPTPDQASDCPAADDLLGHLEDSTIVLADKAFDAG